jgi:hypothetical protein
MYAIIRSVDVPLAFEHDANINLESVTILGFAEEGLA